MTSPFNSTGCVICTIAASVVILSACGGTVSTDAIDNDDAAVATDTIGTDTMPSDVNIRDAGDAVTADAAGDTVDVEIDQDVTGDIGADTTCVPDCTGGACDDGCGGNCCEPPNVCSRDYEGTAMVCLPETGTTCAQIADCSNACGEDACTAECYNAGSADARDTMWAAIDCVTGACPGLDESCLITVYDEGGPCYTEYSTCMDTCTPDCTGGPCTDDGCGGDCCDAPNVCGRDVEGTGTACLPEAGKTCAELTLCLDGCEDQACVNTCYNSGSEDARDAIWAISDCIELACPNYDEGCIIGSYSEGGACYTEYSNCMNSCTPDCTGGPCTDDGCGGDCCDAPNVCRTPESGAGLECVAVGGKTCQQIWYCAVDCGDQDCANECFASGSDSGREQFEALLGCLTDECPSGTEECAIAALESGGACYDEYVACI